MTPLLGRCGLGEAPTSAIVPASRRICSGDRTYQGYPRRVALAAVLFDVDFTLAKPGPDLGPEGYTRLGARYGLDLDASRYDGALRSRGLKLGLVSNTARDLDAFVAHHALDVDAALSSRAHGKVKPHESIFLAVLELLGVAPEDTAMVGDTPTDDVDGARALGISAFLLDREGRFPDADARLTDLRELPAALGLEPF